MMARWPETNKKRQEAFKVWVSIYGQSWTEKVK
jgi:hypothetical protein